MSIPTFNGSALVTKAGRDLPGAPAARIHTETLPGLDGEFIQPHGSAGRRIVVRGVLQATAGTPAQAHQALKADLRAKQALADGRTVGTYVGTDGHAYANCAVVSVQAEGDIVLSQTPGSCTATVHVRAIVRQLTP